MVAPLLLVVHLLTAPPPEPLGYPASDSIPNAHLADGPTVVVHRQPVSEVTSIRLSVLTTDPPGLAGAGLLIQYLTLPQLRERMAEIGGTAEIERTDEAVTFIVTGPSAELRTMTRALRTVLDPPSAGETARLRALRQVERDQLAVWETAPSHVRARLRSELFPEAGMVSGSERSAARLRTADVQELWSSMYRPDRVLVVAAGDVEVARLQAEFADLPAGTAEPREPTVDPVSPRAAPQSTRMWLGSAYRVDRMEPAVLTVLARLVEDDLRSRLPQGEVWVEHWWMHHGQALAIVVAVPERGGDEARSSMDRALERVSETVRSDPEVLRTAARTLWRQMLLQGRSPDRMTMILGQFVARSGNAHEANRFHHALTSVRPRNIDDAAAALTAAPSARFVLPPQPLERD